MPDALVNVVGSGTGAKLLSLTTNVLVPLGHLKVPDGTGEETGRDKVQKAGRGDEEDLELGSGTSLVQKVTDDTTDNQANNGGQRDGGRGGREGDTGDEDDGLDTLTEDGDEGQEEHGVLLNEAAEPALGAGLERRIEGLGELDAPFGLHLTNAEESSSHDGNDEGGEETEGTLIVVLMLLPGVAADSIEDTDESCGDNHADEETNTSTNPNLPGYP